MIISQKYYDALENIPKPWDPNIWLKIKTKYIYFILTLSIECILGYTFYLFVVGQESDFEIK